MKNTWKTTVSMALCITMLPILNIGEASALQSRTDYFSSNYTLSGNGAKDMAAIAMAQKGRTQSQMGYSEAWCADFISDCAVLAGQSAAIPFNATVGAIEDSVLNAGGKKVSSPQAGDLVIYDCGICNARMHVGLMVDSVNSVQGNYWLNGISYCYNVQDVSQYWDQDGHRTPYHFIRPNYKNAVEAPVLKEGAGQTIQDGAYWIVSKLNPNYFVDLPGDEYISEKGCNVSMWNFGNNANSKSKYDAFDFKYLNNGFYKIVQHGTNVAIDVGNKGMDNCTNVGLWKYIDDPYNQWSVIRTSYGYKIQSRWNGLFWDVKSSSTENGTNLLLYSGHDGDNQMFSFIPYTEKSDEIVVKGSYSIKSAHSGTWYAGVSGDPSTYKTNSPLLLTANNTDTFTFEPDGRGYYKIREDSSGLYLTTKDSSSFFDRKKVVLAEKSGSRACQWIIKKYGTNKYLIISKLNGYCLNANESKEGFALNIIPLNKASADRHCWSFTANKDITVSFNPTNGTSDTSSKKVVYGSTYGTLPEPERTGFTFDGWYTSETGGDLITSDAKVTAKDNLTLYAHWTAVPVAAPLELTETSAVIAVGEKYQIEANQDNLRFESNDEDVAIVSINGVISGVSSGSAIITVINSDNDTVFFKVTVMEKVLGDSNCDGTVNMSDAVLIMQSLANPSKYGVTGTDSNHITENGIKNGDMNGDGLTNSDALDIQFMILGVK